MPPRQNQQNESPRWVKPVVLATIFLTAAFLRFFRLGQKPLWLSEIQELVAARSPRWLAQILDSGTDVVGFTWNHLVFAVGLEPGEFATRTLAAICATATIPVTYLLGRRLHSQVAGTVAAILLGLSFYHVYHSQDARAVSYLTFFYALSWLAMTELFFFGAGKKLGRRIAWTTVYAVSAGLAGLSHAIGGIYLLVQGLFFIFMSLWPAWRTAPQFRTLKSATLLRRCLIPALAALPICLIQLYVIADYAFAFLVTRNPVAHSVEIQDLFLVRLYLAHLAGGLLVLQVVQALLFLAGIFFAGLRRSWSAALLGCWFFIPTTALYIVTTGGGIARFEMYHLLPCIVPFVLGVGVGLTRIVQLVALRAGLAKAWVPVAIIGLAVLLQLGASGGQLVRYYKRPIRLYMGEDVRSAAQVLADSKLTGEDVILLNYDEHMAPVNFYGGAELAKARVVVPWRSPNPNWQYHLLTRAWFQSTDSDVFRLLPDQIETLEEYRERGAPGSRVFALYYWMPSMERKGYDDYYRWLTGCDVYVRKPFVNDSSLPAGFTVHRMPGVDLVVSDPTAHTALQALDILVPLTYSNAPPLLRDLAPDVYGSIAGAH